LVFKVSIFKLPVEGISHAPLDAGPNAVERLELANSSSTASGGVDGVHGGVVRAVPELAYPDPVEVEPQAGV